MGFRPKRAVGRALRAMTDPVDVRSLFFTVLCLKGWAYAKFGWQATSKEVVLSLKHLKLCVDVARVELISFWEIWHERCYDAIAVDHPGCVVDVGANVGAFSLYQSIGKHAERVIAFEPSPQVFLRLAKNIEINGLKNVQAVNAAVGDKTGVLSFSEGRMSANCRVSETGSIKVACVRLDDELRDVPSIDILKIDTEGYETNVLRGASETLKKTRQIALELHYPGERQEIESILFAVGFSLARAHNNLVFYCTTTPLCPAASAGAAVLTNCTHTLETTLSRSPETGYKPLN
jgi:FkbM family methyltransferase